MFLKPSSMISARIIVSWSQQTAFAALPEQSLAAANVMCVDVAARGLSVLQ